MKEKILPISLLRANQGVSKASFPKRSPETAMLSASFECTQAHPLPFNTTLYVLQKSNRMWCHTFHAYFRYWPCAKGESFIPVYAATSGKGIKRTVSCTLIVWHSHSPPDTQLHTLTSTLTSRHSPSSPRAHLHTLTSRHSHLLAIYMWVSWGECPEVSVNQSGGECE